MQPFGIYIHIPFCERKCYYCDFNSYAGQGALMEDYLKALEFEIEYYGKGEELPAVQTVFIGGGTPSLLSPKQLEGILQALQANFTLAQDAEITLEANPGTLNFDKLKGYYSLGVNRLSMGLQACQDPLLKTLGRIHSYKMFLENLETARRVGFENINADLMFALPGQTLQDWQETLREMVTLEIPHISAYSLIWEPDTQFDRWLEEGRLSPLEEELELKMYHEAIQFLTEGGYEHYEISNFAKAHYRCRHNQIYWKNEPYLGLGAGAHSYLNGKRFHNESGVKAYIQHCKNGNNPIVEVIDNSLADQISETMFLGLRMTEGISIADFTRRFGKPPEAFYGQELGKLQEEKLLCIENDKIFLTPRGRDLSNQVFVRLLLDDFPM